MTVAELLDILNLLPNDLEIKGFNHEFQAHIDPTVVVEHVIPSTDEDSWSEFQIVDPSHPEAKQIVVFR